MCPSVSRNVLRCPENRVKRGKERGVQLTLLRAIENGENRMKGSNQNKQVGVPDGFDEGTYRFAVCYECFAIADRVVHTKTHERAPVAGGT